MRVIYCISSLEIKPSCKSRSSENICAPVGLLDLHSSSAVWFRGHEGAVYNLSIFPPLLRLEEMSQHKQCYENNFYHVFFLFWLFPRGVATAGRDKVKFERNQGSNLFTDHVDLVKVRTNHRTQLNLNL